MSKRDAEEQNVTWIELRRVKTAKKRWAETFEDEKDREKRRVAAEYENEIARLAQKAHQEGMTKAAIGRALRNKNPEYMTKLLNREIAKETPWQK